MTNYTEIYEHRVGEYHDLVMHEDHQGNLFPALAGIVDFKDKIVVELGAGTGRLTKLIAPLARTVKAFDRSRYMLEHAVRFIQDLARTNVSFACADNNEVPLPDGYGDIVLEGWSFGHGVVGGGSAWKEAADSLLREAFRIVKERGSVVIIETLGTGSEQPAPPDERLGEFYGYLVNEKGFHHRWLRTDYLFHSLDEANALMGMFFGGMTAHRIVSDDRIIVAECTGIWWREKTPGG